MENQRRVELLQSAKWIEIEFENLRIGDIFRMFEPDGTPAEGKEMVVGTEWRVTAGPYKHPEYKVLTVQCVSVEEC